MSGADPEAVNWRTVAAICAVCIGPVALVWAVDLVVRGCAAIPTEDMPFGCGEHLFNRYQTLATGFIAIAIALFSARHIGRQLAQGRRQSAAAGAAVLRVAAEELETERQRTDAMRDELSRKWHGVQQVHYSNLSSYRARIDDLRAQCAEVGRELMLVSLRHDPAVETYRRQVLAIKALESFNLLDRFDSRDDHGWDEMGAWDAYNQRAAKVNADVIQTLTALVGFYERELRLVWREIRSNERLAVGDSEGS